MRIKFFFAWFDFWIGFYYDQKSRALYFCPLPCCVFKVEYLKQDTRTHHVCKPWELIEFGAGFICVTCKKEHAVKPVQPL